MELEDEQRWRDALRQRGKEYVQGELLRRFGGPDDAVLDIVFEPPFPTRAFCSRWCAEQDNRLFSFSKNTVMIIAATMVLFVGVIHMVQSLDAVGVISKQQSQRASANQAKQGGLSSGQAGGRQGGSGQSAEASNSTTPAGQSSFVQAGMQQDGSGSSSSATSSSTSASATPAAVCAYIPYPTALCPQSNGSASSPSTGHGSMPGSAGGSSSTSAFGASAYSGSTAPDTNQPISQGRGMATGYGTPSNYNPQKAR